MHIKLHKYTHTRTNNNHSLWYTHKALSFTETHIHIRLYHQPGAITAKRKRKYLIQTMLTANVCDSVEFVLDAIHAGACILLRFTIRCQTKEPHSIAAAYPISHSVSNQSPPSAIISGPTASVLQCVATSFVTLRVGIICIPNSKLCIIAPLRGVIIQHGHTEPSQRETNHIANHVALCRGS